jgi:hypothetical protein
LSKRDSPPAPPKHEEASARPGGGFTPEEEKLLDRLAEMTVANRMTVPAILLLESVKPLSFLGSQALLFFEPMVRAFFTVPDYDRVTALLERRDSLEALLVRIETRDEDARAAEREAKARRREARKSGSESSGHRTP